MSGPVLYDAVTLRHFAIAGRLDVLETRHSHVAPPRWTEVVRDEITRGVAAGHTECRTVLASPWLGTPIIPTPIDQARILAIQIGLNLGRTTALEHAGEAESLYFAQQLGGTFATDDNAAYDFAERRLGAGRVIDTVAILREAVALGELTAPEARDLAANVRVLGRHLRRIHPAALTSAYFN